MIRYIQRWLPNHGYRGVHRAAPGRPSYLTHVGATEVFTSLGLLSPFRTPMALDMWADAT